MRQTSKLRHDAAETIANALDVGMESEEMSERWVRMELKHGEAFAREVQRLLLMVDRRVLLTAREKAVMECQEELENGAERPDIYK